MTIGALALSSEFWFIYWAAGLGQMSVAVPGSMVAQWWCANDLQPLAPVYLSTTTTWQTMCYFAVMYSNGVIHGAPMDGPGVGGDCWHFHVLGWVFLNGTYIFQALESRHTLCSKSLPLMMMIIINGMILFHQLSVNTCDDVKLFQQQLLWITNSDTVLNTTLPFHSL